MRQRAKTDLQYRAQPWNSSTSLFEAPRYDKSPPGLVRAIIWLRSLLTAV